MKEAGALGKMKEAGELEQEGQSKNGMEVQLAEKKVVEQSGCAVQLKTMKLEKQTADTKKNATVEAVEAVRRKMKTGQRRSNGVEAVGRKMKTGLRRSNGKTPKAGKVANERNYYFQGEPEFKS